MTVPPKLLLTGPKGEKSEHILIADALVLGRMQDCDLVLNDVQASRRHCRIERQDGAWFVQDLTSANGTIINGQPLKERRPLRDGDKLIVGETEVVFRSPTPARAVTRGRGLAPPGMLDPNLSIVTLTDEGVGAGMTLHFAPAMTPASTAAEVASRDVDQLQSVAKRLKLMVDLGRTMGRSIDPHALLSLCLDKLFEVFPQSERGLVILYGPDGSLPATLTPASEPAGIFDRRKGAMSRVKHRSPPSAQENDVRLSRTVLQRVRTEHNAVLIADSGGDSAAMMSMVRMQVKSLMCAPLLVGERDLGILQLETKSREQAFKPEDLSLLTAVAGQVALVIYNAELALEAAASAAQRENLSRFLSPKLVDEVLKGTLGLALGGTEKNGTIFFSDIVGFTRMAAKMRPQDVVTLLNRYFTIMQEVVFRRGGSIDKCAGDQIMAHWGVIGDQVDFTAQAACAAIEMQEALFAFNRDEAMRQEIVLPSEPLGHGIGVNTGTVCAGNIGSDRKIEFTVIGDTVNVSARVEAMAGRTQTFVTEGTWKEIQSRAFAIRIPDMPAKNVELPLPVYCLRGIVPPAAVAPAAPPDKLGDLRFALPCTLRLAKTGAGAARVSGMVTRISPTRGSGARLTVQVVIPVAVDSEMLLDWGVAEKPTLPALRGFVEACWDPEDPTGSAARAADGPGEKGTEDTAVLSRPPEPGSLTLRVLELPDEIAAWRPGTLLVSDMKSHEEVVRA